MLAERPAGSRPVQHFIPGYLGPSTGKRYSRQRVSQGPPGRLGPEPGPDLRSITRARGNADLICPFQILGLFMGSRGFLRMFAHI